jgi:hypothetical protein
MMIMVSMRFGKLANMSWSRGLEAQGIEYDFQEIADFSTKPGYIT